MPSPDGVKGYDVDENAVRFSNYFHVLRELVHFACGWLPLEPSFERKYMLGDNLHDDARSLSKVKRRLYELRHPSDYPGAPGLELTKMLDRMAAASSPGDFISIAYGEVKPALLHAIDIHLSYLDPVVDEPSLRLLRKLQRRTRGHIAHAGLVRRNLQHRDLGAFEIDLRGEARGLQLLPPLDEPARDPDVEVTAEGDTFLVDELYVNGAENHVPTEREEQKHFFHGLMDAELCAAELMARNSHENPDMPWDFHMDMARQTWDELRHARAHDQLMKEELGCKWGDYPIGFSYFKSIYALDLLGRLALFNSTSEQKAMWRHSHRRKVLVDLGQERIARVFDYLLADEVPHVHNGVRWGTWLMDGDEKAYRDKVSELRGDLDATGAPQTS
jgi:hypothetical protein